MLHKKLEEEKALNYPTIGAILCKYYGHKFKSATITAIAEGQESYGFIASCGQGEEYFFKIERYKINQSPKRKMRQNAICRLMEYLHDNHRINPDMVNSPKMIKAENGDYIPVLEADNGIPSDLIGHEITLATKLAAKPFALKNVQLNAFNWNSYPIDVIPMMANTISGFQKAGEKFIQTNPELETLLNGEGGRTIPRPFDAVVEDMRKSLAIPKEDLKKNLLEKMIDMYAMLEIVTSQDNIQTLKKLVFSSDLKALATNLETLQEMYAAILKSKACPDFNPKTFTASLRKFSESEQFGEELAKLGRAVHQLGDTFMLCRWLEDGTSATVQKDILGFADDYNKVYKLKRTKLAHQDANASNFMVENKTPGTRNVCLIDMFLYLSSGIRTYDLAVNLRNACPPNNNEYVDATIAKAMIQAFDENLRLTKDEVYSLWRLFKAVEIGNALHGIAALMARAASIHHLGAPEYDQTIHTQFTLESKKKIIDLDSKRIIHHQEMQKIVDEGRAQTIVALDLARPKQVPLYALYTTKQNALLRKSCSDIEKSLETLSILAPK